VHSISKYSSFKIAGIDYITGGCNRESLNDAGIHCNSQAYDARYLGAVSRASKVADKPIIQVICDMKAIKFAQ